MNKYEVLYIIDAGMEDQARTELIAHFSTLMTENGATIEKVDEWGKRRLAYAIDYKTEGYYVLTTFKANPDVPREIERNLQISESVIRYLVVKLLEKKHSVKPRPVRVAAPAPVVEEAQEAAVEAPADAQ
jgi:small subunit ribosomal protein S6